MDEDLWCDCFTWTKLKGKTSKTFNVFQNKFILRVKHFSEFFQSYCLAQFSLLPPGIILTSEFSFLFFILFAPIHYLPIGFSYKGWTCQTSFKTFATFQEQNIQFRNTACVSWVCYFPYLVNSTVLSNFLQAAKLFFIVCNASSKYTHVCYATPLDPNTDCCAY